YGPSDWHSLSSPAICLTPRASAPPRVRAPRLRGVRTPAWSPLSPVSSSAAWLLPLTTAMGYPFWPLMRPLCEAAWSISLQPSVSLNSPLDSSPSILWSTTSIPIRPPRCTKPFLPWRHTAFGKVELSLHAQAWWRDYEFVIRHGKASITWVPCPTSLAISTEP